MATGSPRRRWWRNAALLYLALLLGSHAFLSLRGAAPVALGARRSASVRAFEAGQRGERTVRLAYHDGFAGGEGGARGPNGTRLSAPEGPVLLLLHGSPGDGANFARLAEELPPHLRLLAPDLPGFGASERDLPDYSIDAHADYVLQLLDRLEVSSAHVVAFSMGGGVAVELAARAPERVRSISMVAAIGVQETELFGNYLLNHAVHGLQLAAIRALYLLVPHFGHLDGFGLDVPYARNFFDTDQRPLRGHLASYAGPMQILHGERDFLVPRETALEHERIVPQSELTLLDGSHFLIWSHRGEVAQRIADFVERVEAGEAATRATADAERARRATAPFDIEDAPEFDGPTLLAALLLLAAATLVSEDLTCIGAGLMVAQGRMGFFAATAACFFGIFVGDLLLYLAGRWLGRPALGKAPLKWFVKEASVENATHWFEARGARVIFLSRFLPGLRLPTYVAAGLLRMRLLTFAFYFLLAGALWTPILVGCATLAGQRALGFLHSFERWALPAFVLFALGILCLQRLIVPLFSYRGRRLLLGAWRRKRHFEFWHPLFFYGPVALYILWQGLRHRSLAVVTAVNPAIPTGGFVGESKGDILAALSGTPEYVARFRLLPATDSADERRRVARTFMRDEGLSFPIVLKPDVGQRGSGVRILKSAEELDAALEEMSVDCLLQEFVPGPEYGVFYIRRPGEARGKLFSITEKTLPVVHGDGERTLEQLILRDERAVCAAATYFESNAHRLQHVPAAGEAIELVELGAHCRGAVFLDGARLASSEVERVIERISSGFDGFHFGRYDVRAHSEGHFRRGEGFKILELNGLTSEATHIYDPKHGVGHAYRTLFEQWRAAFEIASENRRRGARVWTPRELFRAWRDYRRLQKRHAG